MPQKKLHKNVTNIGLNIHFINGFKDMNTLWKYKGVYFGRE